MLVAVRVVRAFLLPPGVGSVTLGAGRLEAAPMPGPRSPRPVVIWTTWIGASTLTVNASSLLWFLVVSPSIVAAPLLWLMPLSLCLCVIDVTVYLRERLATSRSSVPPRRWVIHVIFSLSLVMFVLVVLCVALFHNAQLGNLDPGGL